MIMGQFHTTQKTVIVRSLPEGILQKEWLMDAAVLPGMMVEIASSTRIQVCSGTLHPELKVVIESGTTPTNGTYASGDQIPFVMPRSGDEVMVYGTSSALATIAVGNVVFGATGGFVSQGTAIAGAEGVGVALESATIAADPGLTQFKIEVL